MPGLPGQAGRPGRDGLPGQKGERGLDGLSGERGDLGQKGERGLPGLCPPTLQLKGDKGDRGIPGSAGQQGQSGDKGDKGERGLPGLPGEKGNPGLAGLSGDPGLPGPKGQKGEPGLHGSIGPRGLTGPQGRIGSVFIKSGLLLARHSQSSQVPTCPSGTEKLWEGYSLLYFTGNEKAHQQDLGTAGSCLQRFSVAPFVRCDLGNICNYAQNNDLSYWLSTSEPIPHGPVQRTDIQRYLSRCVACEAPANVIAVHSQTDSVPNCPSGWARLWDGYSFVMVCMPKFLFIYHFIL